jgi:hypothetical protein
MGHKGSDPLPPCGRKPLRLNQNAGRSATLLLPDERGGDVDKLGELVARREIEDCLLRYARGVDRRDWDCVRTTYHADAQDWHGEFKGSVDGFIAWVDARHAAVPFSMHFLGNCLVEFIDDVTAAVETYFVAIQRREVAPGGGEQPKPGTDIEVFGRYCDRFEQRGGVWRVADRQVVYDSTRSQPSTNHLRKIVGAAGRRDGSDPVFGLHPQADARLKTGG